MKRTFYLFSVALLAFSLCAASPAKAKDNDDKDNHGHDKGNGDDNGGSSSTNLPINANIVYLMIAGVAIGVVATKKAKRANAAV